MRSDFKYRQPRIHSGDLRTPVKFYEYRPNQGPIPGESKYDKLFECMAKVDTVWLKDLETAKANNTISDVTLTIRDTKGEFIPTNRHYLKIEAEEYEDLVYNVFSVQPDLQNRDFVTIVAKLKGDMRWQ